MGSNSTRHTVPAARLRPGKVTAGALTAAVVTTLVAAGCSSSSSSTPTTSTSSGSASAAATSGAVPQVAALVPSAIKAKGVTVAMDATYPPDEFIASDGHTIIGLDADLGKALGQAMGIKWNPVNATFATIIPGLQSGKYDMGASSFGDTKAREKVVNFVDYYQAGTSFFTKSSGGASISGLADLCGKSVSVESGTTEEADAKTQSGKCKAAGKPVVNVLVYPTQSAANVAL